MSKIKTNIKIRVTPEQSKKIQEICFENGIYWVTDRKIDRLNEPFLFIDEYVSFMHKDQEEVFVKEKNEEVDADLFIRTNGTCIENTNEHLDRLDDTFKEREPIIEDRMNQFIEDIKKENNPFLDFDKLVKEKNNKEDSHNAHYKAQKIDTIARCKANMTLEQQKAICIFNCDKYLHREKGQNLSDIQKVRYYLDWLEEIEIQLKDE